MARAKATPTLDDLDDAVETISTLLRKDKIVRSSWQALVALAILASWPEDAAKAKRCANKILKMLFSTKRTR